MQYIVYVLLRILILIIYFMPFRLLFIFSDFAYFIIYYIIGYRKEVVYTNLKNSFPEKTADEIEFLAKQFYRFLSDLFFESLKGMSLTLKQVELRHKYINPEVLNSILASNRSVICVAAHYGNWEWGAFSGANQVKAPMIVFYKPLSNKVIDKYMIRSRESFNCHMIPIVDTYNTFNRLKNEVGAFFMVADQSPSNMRRSYWYDFLNQDTPFLHGPEKYARLYNLPVVNIEIKRVKRGYYELYFSLLADNPLELPDGEITHRYAMKLESTIKADPTIWLWSHRRWKRTRSDIKPDNN
jgi:Kdo2-lipid IVA lauroyltransferase/acyltransferase